MQEKSSATLGYAKISQTDFKEHKQRKKYKIRFHQNLKHLLLKRKQKDKPYGAVFTTYISNEEEQILLPQNMPWHNTDYSKLVTFKKQQV